MKKILLLTLVTCMLFVTACSKTDSSDEIKTVNETKHEIKDEEYDKVLNDYKKMYERQVGEESWKTLKDDEVFQSKLEEMVLDTMTLEKIFIDEAKKNNLSVTDDEVAAEFDEFKANYESEEAYQEDLKNNELTEDLIKDRINKQLIINKFIGYKSDLINKITPTDEELKEFYDTNKQLFNKIRASHILVDDQEKAQNIKKQLDEGADFAELAKEFSKDANKDQGGDLGYFSPDKMVKEFSVIAFSLDKDEISEPVKTQYGWHIIKVTDKQNSYESVNKEELTYNYKTDVYDKMCNNYIENANLKISDRLKAIRERSAAVKNQAE
ncbi:peptidylprolyl isomerase [Sedimentibacter sp. zth1]|uniref:peptidylprolyl isomerase n=1 Tax=Sedimentibacter sp. zth1 TaxID=2816908 RepID=UPI001A913D09|nr:peptidylprolyl isomerase [Sedimentibacter sp. zth1]QSX06376.1 peptidylprolyl isomerase [Sedimentibacter sp. zth1]